MASSQRRLGDRTGRLDGVDDLMTLPAVPWAPDAVELVLDVEPRSVANHSLRSWQFAVLLARHEGISVSASLLFAATVLHDLGLARGADAPVRFEVDGADRAAAFLTARGLPGDEVDQVWEAIALHTSPGIAERRGPLAYLTREGVGIDFGRGTDCVSDPQAGRIHAAHPRLRMEHELVEAIVAQCRRVPERGPRYSIAGELTRERDTPPHVTRMESAARQSRWGAA